MNSNKLKRKTIEIIVPIYNEDGLISEFIDAVKPIMDGLDIEWGITFINDGSIDKTREKLDNIVDLNPRIQAVHFSRNFGKEAALTAAFDLSSADAIIPMDIDLQDPPEVLPKMIAAWKDGFEIITAVRNSRSGDNLLRVFATNLFYKFFSRFVGFNVIKR